MRFPVVGVTLVAALVASGCGGRSIRVCGPGESIPPGAYAHYSVSSDETWVWAAGRPIEEVVVDPPVDVRGQPARLGADFSGTISGDTVRIRFRAAGAYAVKVVYRGGAAPPDVRLVLVDTAMGLAEPPPKASPGTPPAMPGTPGK